MGLLICPVINWTGKREFERTGQTENRTGEACAPIIRTSRWEPREQKCIEGHSAGATMYASLHGEHPPLRRPHRHEAVGSTAGRGHAWDVLTSLAKQVSSPPSRYMGGFPLISSLMWSLAMWLALLKRMPHLRRETEHLSEFSETVEDRGPGVLQSMGSQRVGHNLATEQQRHNWAANTCLAAHTSSCHGECEPTELESSSARRPTDNREPYRPMRDAWQEGEINPCFKP